MRGRHTGCVTMSKLLNLSVLWSPPGACRRAHVASRTRSWVLLAQLESGLPHRSPAPRGLAELVLAAGTASRIECSRDGDPILLVDGTLSCFINRAAVCLLSIRPLSCWDVHHKLTVANHEPRHHACWGLGAALMPPPEARPPRGREPVTTTLRILCL